jgi:hypothetical protein
MEKFMEASDWEFCGLRPGTSVVYKKVIQMGKTTSFRSKKLR